MVGLAASSIVHNRPLKSSGIMDFPVGFSPVLLLLDLELAVHCAAAILVSQWVVGAPLGCQPFAGELVVGHAFNWSHGIPSPSVIVMVLRASM